ncbi:MAG: DUF4397 domain-containing protein [Saprospiraceae bacterium]
MKNLFSLLLLLAFSLQVSAQDARVQFIHNAPKVGNLPGESIDVYVNGSLLPELSGLQFLHASHFINLPAGIPLTLSIALSPSNSVADAFKTIAFNGFQSNTNYTAQFVGEMGSTGIPFQLIFNEGTSTSNGSGTVNLLFAHGSPQLQAIDVDIRDQGSLVNDIAFKEFAQFYSLPPQSYLLDVKLDILPDIIQSYTLNLSTYANQAITLITSGYVNNNPAFGLYVVLNNGNVFPLPATPLAKVQFIQNSAAQTIDVYAQNQLLVNNIQYRSASGFLDVPAGQAVQIGVALANSVSVNDTIFSRTFTLKNGENYVMTANGLFGNNVTPFDIISFENALRFGSNQDSISALLVHGSTNASTVDLRLSNFEPLFVGVQYDHYTGYKSLNPQAQAINVYTTNTNQVIGSYNANLIGLESQSMTLVLSGELGGLPGMTLFGVLADGTILNFIENNYARVQVIQNTTTPELDIYFNGSLWFDNMGRQTAMPFENQDGNVMVSVAVAPANSTSVADAFYQTNVLLGIGRTYQLVLHGEEGNAAAPLSILYYDDVFESGRDPLKLSVNFTNTAVDLGEVDLFKDQFLKLFAAVNSPGTRDYVDIDPGAITWDLRRKNSSRILGRYHADFSNLGGSSVTLLTSGKYHGDPNLTLLAVYPDGHVDTLEDQSIARIQFIHNASDDNLKLYVSDTILSANLNLHYATPFIEYTGDNTILLGIARDTSSAIADTLIQIPFDLEIGKTYQCFIEGNPSDPADPIRLLTSSKALSENTDFSSVLANFVNSEGLDQAVDLKMRSSTFIAKNIVIDGFSSYESIEPKRYLLDLYPAGQASILGTYEAILTSNGAEAITVFSYPDSSNASLVSLWACNQYGQVWNLPYKPTAYIQVIQNAPDYSFDVFQGNSLWINELGFRTASSWLEINADQDILLSFANDTAQTMQDTIISRVINVANGNSTIVMAIGQKDNVDFPLDLLKIDNGKQFADSIDEVDIALVNGGIDLPGIKIKGRKSGVWTNNLQYSETVAYQSFDAVADYLDITEASSQDLVGTYDMALQQYPGQSIVIFMSGVYSGSPDLGLYGAFADGSVIEFQSLSLARLQIFNNSKDTLTDLYLGDSLWISNFNFAKGSNYIDLPADSLLQFGFAPAGSTSSAGIQAVFPITLEKDSIYQWISSGSLGDLSDPLALYLSKSRILSLENDQTDLRFFQGIAGSSAVDVAMHNSLLLLSDLEYTNYSEYLSLSSSQALFDIKDHNTQEILGTFEANLGSWQGQAITLIITESLLDPSQLAVFALLPSGSVISLARRTFAKYQIIQNSPGPGIDVYQGLNKFIDDMQYKTARPFLEIPAEVNMQVGFAAANSVNALDVIKTLNFQPDPDESYIIMINGAIGNVDFPLDVQILTNAKTQSETDSTVDIVFFHGALDSIAVELSAKQIGVLQNNLAYGQFGDYKSILAKNYLVFVKDASTQQYIRGFGVAVSSLGGEALTIVLSGMENGPGHFILYGVLKNGTIINFAEQQGFANVQLLQNSTEDAVDIYLNGQLLIDDFANKTGTGFQAVIADLPVQFGIALQNSTSVLDTFLNVNVVLDANGNYLLMLNGILADPETPIELTIIPNAKTNPSNPGKMEYRFVNGTSDAPALDFTQSGVPLFTDISYTANSGYTSQSPSLYSFKLTDTNEPDLTYGQYEAPFADYAGEVFTVFGTGILLSGVGIQLWVLKEDGETFQLDYKVGTSNYPNALRAVSLYPNPAGQIIFLDFESNISDVIQLQWLDLNGKRHGPRWTSEISNGSNHLTISTSGMEPGMYILQGNGKGIELSQKVVILK